MTTSEEIDKLPGLLQSLPADATPEEAHAHWLLALTKVEQLTESWQAMGRLYKELKAACEYKAGMCSHGAALERRCVPCHRPCVHNRQWLDSQIRASSTPRAAPSAYMLRAATDRACAACGDVRLHMGLVPRA